MSTDWRIGQGSDVHQLVEGRRLMLGGIRIEHDRGLLAHSDGDVLLHAVMDALLGACGLGDIGEHFPDHNPHFKNADSAMLLKHVMDEVRQNGWKPRQLDCTILAEHPRLGPVKWQIRSRLAELLDLSADDVNVKAKTAEGMGPIGRGEAIEAHAIVVIEPAEEE